MIAQIEAEFEIWFTKVQLEHTAIAQLEIRMIQNQLKDAFRAGWIAAAESSIRFGKTAEELRKQGIDAFESIDWLGGDKR